MSHQPAIREEELKNRVGTGGEQCVMIVTVIIDEMV